MKPTTKAKPTCRNLVLGCSVGLMLMGCAQQQQRGRYHPTPAPAMTQKAPEAQPTKVSCADPTPGLIKLTKTMPPEVSMGNEFATELHLTAQGCVANVVVRDTVPANASYLRSEPSAAVEGN